MFLCFLVTYGKVAITEENDQFFVEKRTEQRIKQRRKPYQNRKISRQYIASAKCMETTPRDYVKRWVM